jgi:hypothetical protein
MLFPAGRLLIVDSGLTSVFFPTTPFSSHQLDNTYTAIQYILMESDINAGCILNLDSKYSFSYSCIFKSIRIIDISAK